MGRARLVFVFAMLALAASASAQDHDPYRDDPFEKSRTRPVRPETSPPPPPPTDSTYDPNDEAPPPDAAPPPGAPRPAAPAETKTPEAKKEDEIQVQTNGRVRLELGYDRNVFRAERGATGDGFFHGYGEADMLVRFPGERELFASVSGEGYAYMKEQAANESYGSSFLDYYHPLSPIFDVDVQNTFEYSAQNLLDDNGDLLPRAKFNAYDEESRATLIVHVGSRLSFEASGGGRYKRFEDNPGLDSLTYWELRGSAGVRYKPWTDGRFKLRYVFRDRRYTELTANLRDSLNVPGDPKLELYRHQVAATFSQRAEVFGMQFAAQLGYTFTYNQDPFQNDRSYRENALSAHVEWWPFPNWTELEGDVRGGYRSFLARPTLQRADPRFGTRLEQGYVEVTLAFVQKLLGEINSYHVSLVVEASYYLYHSTDVRSSYDRLVAQAGLEGAF